MVLMKPLGTVGLALASNFAVVVQAVYLQVHLARKRAGFDFRPLLLDLVKVVGAACVMGVAVGAGWRYWRSTYPPTDLFDITGMLLVIGLGIALYAGLVWLLRIEGREEFAAVVEKVRVRFGGAR